MKKRIRGNTKTIDEARIVHLNGSNVFSEAKKLNGAKTTKEDMDWIAQKIGTTEDIQETGWIMPDGRMLDMGRTEERYYDGYVIRDVNGKEITDPRRWEHDCIPLPEQIEQEIDRLDIMPCEYLLAAGWIRCDAAGCAFVQSLRKPTPEQMDRLYDFADAEWETMRNFYRHRTGITDFSADIGDRSIVYDDADEFRKRLMNDIRNFRTGSLGETMIDEDMSGSGMYTVRELLDEIDSGFRNILQQDVRMVVDAGEDRAVTSCRRQSPYAIVFEYSATGSKNGYTVKDLYRDLVRLHALPDDQVKTRVEDQDDEPVMTVGAGCDVPEKTVRLFA